MNKYLFDRYALHKDLVDNRGHFTGFLLAVLKYPALHFIFFGWLMFMVGNMTILKILPYSWQSAFATTLSYSIAAVGFW